MRFFKKLIVVLLAVTLLGGVFYFVFEKPQKSEASPNPLLSFFSGIRKEVEEAAENALSDSKKFMDQKSGAIKEDIQEDIQKKKNQLLSFLQENVNEAIDAVQEKIIGSDEDGVIVVIPVAKVGSAAYFLISNPTPKQEVHYTVDWGDGLVEEETLAGTSKIISHVWSKKGEFLVRFKTSGSDVVSNTIKMVITQ